MDEQAPLAIGDAFFGGANPAAAADHLALSPQPLSGIECS